MMNGAKDAATELDVHRGFETQWNRAQSVIQVLLGVMILAGLLGVFGDGWLARAEADLPGTPLTVRYDRFVRAGAPARMTVSLTRPFDRDTIEIGLGAALLERVSIDATQPRAEAVDATPAGVAYRFRLAPEHRGDLTFMLSPRGPGLVTAVVSGAGSSVELPLVIYP